MSRFKRRKRAEILQAKDYVSDVELEELDELDEEFPSELIEDDLFDEADLQEDFDDEVVISEDDFDEPAFTARRSRRSRRPSRRASETEKGIEDLIQDTAGGGDPSVSKIASDVSDELPDEESVAANYKRMKRLASQLRRAGHRKEALRVNKLASMYLRSNRRRMAESQDDGLFPGDVGNMERSKNYRKIDQYHTFKPSLNHWEPDMRHEWKDNPRTETGHGIPKVASLYRAAQNSVKLALMLLGEDATEEDIERQARDFMKLGNSRIVASINRWMKAEDESADVDDEVEVTDDNILDVDVVEAEDGADDIDVVVEDDATADTDALEADDAEEVVEIDDGVAAEDIDFDVASNDEVEADAELENIFADEDSVEDDEKPIVAKRPTKKQGIKRLGGQPKIARTASHKVDDLESLWDKLDSPSL